MVHDETIYRHAWNYSRARWLYHLHFKRTAFPIISAMPITDLHSGCPITVNFSLQLMNTLGEDVLSGTSLPRLARGENATFSLGCKCAIRDNFVI
jgi:hypothetical protein